MSSTTGAGQGGSLTLTATESASISGLGSGLFSTAASTGDAGEITVSTRVNVANGAERSPWPLRVPVMPVISSLSVNNFSLTGGAQVEQHDQ